MSQVPRVIPNRPAALKAYRDLAERVQPDTTVGHRSQSTRRGVVGVNAGRSIRIDRAAPRGYTLRVFVVWEGLSPSWEYANDLVVIALPLTTAQIAAELRSVLDRIDATFDESADRHTADTHLCLEDVESLLSVLLARIEETAGGAS